MEDWEKVRKKTEKHDKLHPPPFPSDIGNILGCHLPPIDTDIPPQDTPIGPHCQDQHLPETQNQNATRDNATLEHGNCPSHAEDEDKSWQDVHARASQPEVLR